MLLMQNSHSLLLSSFSNFCVRPLEKMTVRGTIVRSEVCDAGCFCLESLIIIIFILIITVIIIIMHHASCVMRHVSCIIHHISCVMCHVWLCNLKFCFIVPFYTLCHLTFRAIWNFVSFDISCDLIHHYNNCHQSNYSIYVQVVVKDRCVFKKWARV